MKPQVEELTHCSPDIDAELIIVTRYTIYLFSKPNPEKNGFRQVTALDPETLVDFKELGYTQAKIVGPVKYENDRYVHYEEDILVGFGLYLDLIDDEKDEPHVKVSEVLQIIVPEVQQVKPRLHWVDSNGFRLRIDRGAVRPDGTDFTLSNS